MLFFTRWKAAAIVLTALVVCLFAVPNFFPESVVEHWPGWAQRHIVLGLDLQGGSSLLLKSTPTPCARSGCRRSTKMCCACCAKRASRSPAAPCAATSVEVHITRSTDVDNALSKLRALSQPMSGFLGTTGQRDVDVSRKRRPDHADADRAGDHRADPPSRRSIDRDHPAPRQRTRPRRTEHPARGRRPHSGAGARSAGSDAAEGNPRQNRETGFPHGRSIDDGGAGGGLAPAGRFGNSRRPATRREISDRETRARFRLRSRRRASGLRPADQPADRQLPLQFVRRAKIRPGDASQCRQAFCNCAR